MVQSTIESCSISWNTILVKLVTKKLHCRLIVVSLTDKSDTAKVEACATLSNHGNPSRGEPFKEGGVNGGKKHGEKRLVENWY